MLPALRSPLCLLLGTLTAACSALPQDDVGLSGRSRFDEEFRDMRWAFEAGQRNYSDDSWGQIDEGTAVGITGTSEPPHWLLGLDGGLFWSGGDIDVQGLVNDVSVDTWEGFAGVMKSVPLFRDRLVAEVGAGYSLSYAYADVDDDNNNTVTYDYTDSWWSGGYARAALLLRLGDDAWIGISARSVRGGSADLVNTSLDGDYDQIAFVLASRW